MVHLSHLYDELMSVGVTLDYAPACRSYNQLWGRCVVIVYLISVVPRQCGGSGSTRSVSHFVASTFTET